MFSCVLIYSCSSVIQTNNNQLYKSNQQVYGLWTEHWEKDSTDTEGNVTYVDTVKNFQNKDKLKMECINDKSFKYYNAIFVNNELKFTVENLEDPT